jgi:CheY-like chemotaxis protein
MTSVAQLSVSSTTWALNCSGLPWTEALPSLILLDLMMPVMDGFEFVMELRKVERWRGIPIVVVTAKDLTDDDRRRLNGDVVGLIQKSGLDRKSLLAQLREQVAAVCGPRSPANRPAPDLSRRRRRGS